MRRTVVLAVAVALVAQLAVTAWGYPGNWNPSEPLMKMVEEIEGRGRGGGHGRSMPAAPGMGAMQRFRHVPLSEEEPCIITDGTHHWDLNQMSLANADYTGTDGRYNYLLNLCGRANAPSCARHKASICQYSANGNFVATIGSFVEKPEPKFRLQSAQDPAAGVAVTMTNGDLCYIGGAPRIRTAVVHIRCNKDADSTVFQVLEDKPTCTFTIDIESPWGCPDYYRGLTPVAAFIWGSLLLLCIYLVLGVVYNRVRWGTPVSQALPNKAFWANVPGKSKALSCSMWRRVKRLVGLGGGDEDDDDTEGLLGGGEGGYEPVW